MNANFMISTLSHALQTIALNEVAHSTVNLFHQNK